MVEINTPLIAIIITVLLTLLSLAAAWGVLSEKVKTNRKDIESERTQNREDHQRIFSKLEEIKQEISNGNR